MKMGLDSASERMPAPGPRRDQHRDRLRVLRRVAGARIEQMTVASAVHFEVALVIARGADRLAVAQFERGQRRAATPCGRGCWMPTRQGLPLSLPSAMTLPPMLIRALLTPCACRMAAARSSATPLR